MTETQVQHKWLWAISPSSEKVIFVAHCRLCNSYYTEKLIISEWGSNLGKVSLPEWGCVIPPGFMK